MNHPVINVPDNLMSKVYIKEVGAIRVTPLPANLIHTSATSFIFWYCYDL